jgi:hypothetical protein
MRDEIQCQLRKKSSLNKLAAMAQLITEPLQRQSCIDSGTIAASELH